MDWAPVADGGPLTPRTAAEQRPSPRTDQQRPSPRDLPSSTPTRGLGPGGGLPPSSASSSSRSPRDRDLRDDHYSMVPTPRGTDVFPARTPRTGGEAMLPQPARTPRTTEALAAASAAIAAFDDAKSTISRFTGFSGGAPGQTLTPRGAAAAAAALLLPGAGSARRKKSEGQMGSGRGSPLPSAANAAAQLAQSLSEPERRARVVQWTARLEELRSLHAEASDRLVFANQRIQVRSRMRGEVPSAAPPPHPPPPPAQSLDGKLTTDQPRAMVAVLSALAALDAAGRLGTAAATMSTSCKTALARSVTPSSTSPPPGAEGQSPTVSGASAPSQSAAAGGTQNFAACAEAMQRSEDAHREFDTRTSQAVAAVEDAFRAYAAETKRAGNAALQVRLKRERAMRMLYTARPPSTFTHAGPR